MLLYLLLKRLSLPPQFVILASLLMLVLFLLVPLRFPSLVSPPWRLHALPTTRRVQKRAMFSLVARHAGGEVLKDSSCCLLATSRGCRDEGLRHGALVTERVSKGNERGLQPQEKRRSFFFSCRDWLESGVPAGCRGG